jgi:phosphomevalonate kinase
MESFGFRVPGKVVINGSYLVLRGGECRAVALKAFLRCEVRRSALGDNKVVVWPSEAESLTYAAAEDGSYHLRIVGEFYRTTGLSPRGCTEIRMALDDAFFVKGKSKTGIGSSACILVALVYALLRVHQNEMGHAGKVSDMDIGGEPPWPDEALLEKPAGTGPGARRLLYSLAFCINRRISPGSSGCDIACSIFGSVRFSRRECSQAGGGMPGTIVLGSFGGSTSTREMLSKIRMEGEKWEELSALNMEINGGKRLFERYLDVLRAIDTRIVPDRQYAILKESFRRGVWGCGIAGAGGDDAVWVMAESPGEIRKYWESVFDHVAELEVDYDGIQ